MRQNRKSIVQSKNPSPPKSMLLAKFYDFGNKTWPDSTYWGGRGKKFEFEKFSHFLNLLDFQLLSEEVLPRVVENF